MDFYDAYKTFEGLDEKTLTERFDFASIFNIGLFALNSDDTVCHCEVKENAELIAQILDFDVNGEVYQPNCENCKYYHKKFVRLSKNESDS